MRLVVVTAVAIGFILVVSSGCSSSDGGHAPPPAAEVPLPEVLGVPVLEDENPDPNVVEVHLAASTATMMVDGVAVTMRGYNNVIPGPMLRAKVGDEVIVH